MCRVHYLLNFHHVAIWIPTIGCAYWAACKVGRGAIKSHPVLAQAFVLLIDILYVKAEMRVAVVVNPILGVDRLAGWIHIFEKL